MQRFYPIIQAGRRPRHRLSGIMRGGFVLVLSALMLPAAANATAESSVTVTISPQDTRGGGIRRTVSGIVEDTHGAAVAGASVVIKGSSRGTLTDNAGHYALEGVEDGDLLEISFLGMLPQTVKVGAGRTSVDVVLSEDMIGLEDVVVTGYTTMKRKDITGSVSSISADRIERIPAYNITTALTGIAGIRMDGGSIRIRGTRSRNASNDPLIVLDGIPYDETLASINPGDIESIDVLKDASATAIYGARGANGVIVINTKRGNEGKPTVNFSASFSLNKIANKADLMDSYEFVRLQSELISEETMNKSYFSEGLTLDDYRHIPGIDWQDQLYRTAFQQNYNVSLSGGNKEGLRYNVGFSALDQDGIIIRSNFQRYQGKANFTLPISKKLTLNANANYSRTATNGVTPTTAQTTSSSSGWLMYSVWGYRPVTPPGQDILDSMLDEAVDGSNDYRFNPVKTAKNEYRKTLVDYLNANLALTWKITPDLTFKTTGGYVLNKRRREEFNGSETYTGYAGSPSGKGVNGAIYWTDQTSWSNENTLNYKKRLGRSHNLDLMAGLSLQGQKNTYDGVASTQITSEELGIAGIHTGNYQKVQSNYYDWRMMSAFLRANYNFRYKYYLTFSFRADGSSKFPSDNRWGYFPSAGLSWNFNRENLLKKSEWMSNGKLRLSWGLTGNNRTQTPYDFYSQITVNPGSGNSLDYVFGGERVPGYYVSNMANERLKWETTEQWNAGLDLGFFEDRIKVTADWYDKVTRDLLLYALLPASSGFEQGMLNIGKIRNRGFELTLETVNVKTRQFQWSTSFNIAFNRNRILGLVDGQNTLQSSVSWETRFNSQFPYISQVGKPTGMMYGFIYDGTYKAEDFDDKGNLVSGVPSFKGNAMQPGDMKYRDMNGDGVIDDYDRTIIGCGQPLNTGGFGNNFNWKNFDLNIFFAWSYGNDVLNANRLVFESGWRSQTNQLASYADRWSPENPASNIPRVNAVGREEYSSRVIEDGSFLRLKNVSLGYTLPSRSLRKAGISQMRVYVSADNIWTLTGYSGPDPEVSTRNSVLTPGFDWSAYPRAFGFTAGVNLTF